MENVIIVVFIYKWNRNLSIQIVKCMYAYKDW